MSTRGARGKPTTGRSNSAGSDEDTTTKSASVPAVASVPVTASATASVTSLDPAAGRKASSDLVTQQQLALLANQFLTTARNFTDVDIDISQDADMLSLAKSRFDSGVALIGLLEPHVASNRECKNKYSDLEVACFKIASKSGAQPWAQRYVSNYRSGASSSAASSAAAAASAVDTTSPIMTLASAAAASASALPLPANSTATARPMTAPTAFPMLNNPMYPTLPPTVPANNNNNNNNNILNMTGMPTPPAPVSERYVVLGRNLKPKEKKPEEISIPGKGRKKINPSDIKGKSSNVLSSCMYAIQTHTKNGGKISILLSQAFKRRNIEKRTKRKRKFGEVDAAVNKLQRNNNNNSNNANEDDDDSEDDEQRAAFFNNNNSSGNNNNARNRLPLATPQELQQLEAEMMQSFDNTLQSIRRFREARGDFQQLDEKANYFAAFAAPDGRFYGEQGNIEKGEYELMMQMYEALVGKPQEQHCRFSSIKTKYNTFQCPYELLGIVPDEVEEGGDHYNNNNNNNNDDNNNNMGGYQGYEAHMMGGDNNNNNQPFNI